MVAMSHSFSSSDGVRLAWHEVGPADGRPLLLLHGLFSNAEVNWIKFGTAERLAEAGLRCLMLDFRAHGDSDAPTTRGAYPPNVLAKDVGEWVRHLNLAEFDLAGFSLGGRTAVLAVIEGVRPRRLAVCGMGLKGIVDQTRGTAWFLSVIDDLGKHPKSSDEYFAEAFMKTNGMDPEAARWLLRAQIDAAKSDVAAIDTPTRVICGAEDRYREEAERLAALMPNAGFAEIPGTHMSSVSQPELGEELAAFFDE